MKLSPAKYGAVVLVLILFAFAESALWKILRTGGKPSVVMGRVEYPIRPNTRLLLFLFMLAGMALIVQGLRLAFHSDWTNAGWAEGFGIPVLGGGLYSLSAKLVVDDDGMSCRRGWGKETLIAWKNLDHVEIDLKRKGGPMYWFRPKNGKSIGISDIEFDTQDLLQRIDDHTSVDLEVYQRRKWWGG